ncbi:hypothetical protein OG252_02145 [Streptomyces sp. NBC_01352]|uniref:hypothetical protein n=1 Tax=unclassified Streptomyces TaxID=2593676 RepID=UPI0022500BD0|nr:MULTISPECIES: hypothetical protein [unclassified Streptomyces]MCX4706633.1 hypothetical protein [Streptomyces sp. NBC_01373]
MTETTLRQNMPGETCCEIQRPRTIAGEVHAAILDAEAEPGTKGTVGWGHAGDPEKRIRATVAPASCKADHRLLRLPAA